MSNYSEKLKDKEIEKKLLARLGNELKKQGK